MAHYSNGASYTQGPTSNISMNVTSMVREFGGEVFINASVVEIILNHENKAIGVKVCNTSDLIQQSSSSSSVEQSNLTITSIYAKNIGILFYNIYL